MTIVSGFCLVFFNILHYLQSSVWNNLAKSHYGLKILIICGYVQEWRTYLLSVLNGEEFLINNQHSNILITVFPSNAFSQAWQKQVYRDRHITGRVLQKTRSFHVSLSAGLAVSRHWCSQNKNGSMCHGIHTSIQSIFSLLALFLLEMSIFPFEPLLLTGFAATNRRIKIVCFLFTVKLQYQYLPTLLSKSSTGLS